MYDHHYGVFCPQSHVQGLLIIISIIIFSSLIVRRDRPDETEAIRIVRDGRRPVCEDGLDANLPAQHVKDLIQLAISVRDPHNRRVVVVHVGRDARQGAGALEGPRDDVEPRGLGGQGVRGGDDGLVVRRRHQQVVEGRGDDVDALCLEGRQACHGGRVVGRCVAGLVEVDGLLTEVVVLCQPLEDVGRVEGLWPHALRVDATADEGVDHVARVLLLRVAVEGHRDLRGRLLKLGGEVPVAGERVDERDVAVERHDGAAGVVELGPPCGRAVLVVLGCLGARVEAVLLAAQSLVLCGRDVAGAAERICWRGGVGGREGHRALGS